MLSSPVICLSSSAHLPFYPFSPSSPSPCLSPPPVHHPSSRLPATVGPNPRADLCQTGNFICNAQGRLLKLSLGFAGMSCPLPVEELSALDALQTITLDYNDFQGSSLDDLRQVRRGVEGACVCGGARLGCVGRG